MVDENRKKEILDEIEETIGKVQRMIEVGYEGSTANDNENIASRYAELGNEEESIKYYLKSLDVLKLTKIEERHTPYWYGDYMNTLGTMCAYAENIPRLKDLAQSMAMEALDEFNYNIGAVTSWVTHGLSYEVITDKEAMEIVAKGLDKFDLTEYEEKFPILSTLQELYSPIYNSGGPLKDKCLALMRNCAEDIDEDSKKDLEVWLASISIGDES